MPNFYYNYLSTPDYVDPLFRAKMAGFGGYIISWTCSAAFYGLALFGGGRVPQVGVTCVRWMMTGTSMGVIHAAGSYMSSKFSGKTDHWGNHMIGGFAAGLLSSYSAPVRVRIQRGVILCLFSGLMKAYVLEADKGEEWPMPQFGERYTVPYLTLNHRFMNPDAKVQEEELEKEL